MILPATSPEAIARCVQTLRQGGLIGLPTETVYGLAASADSDAAVAQIFAAKGRPAQHPLIVHVSAHDGGMSGVAHYAVDVPPFARQLMAAFWPGPLTLILPRRAGVAGAAAGGQNSIGLRGPAHPAAQAVLRALRDGPDAVWGLAAPSANRFGRVSPTSAAHVEQELGTQLLVLDGGDCALGIESSIVDCTRGAPVLLRPGTLTRRQIEDACGRSLLTKEEQESQHQRGLEAPKASGTLDSHYAPHARVQLYDSSRLQRALQDLEAGAHIAVYARTALPGLPASVLLRTMPASAAVAAHELFAVLRACDAAGVRAIWIETPPDTPDWEGVRDRLQRAAA